MMSCSFKKKGKSKILMGLQTIKTFFFIVFSCLFFGTISTGQTIKDYFIPETPYNKAILFMPDVDDGTSTGMFRKLYYFKIGTKYKITDVSLFQGETSSTISRTIIIGSNEVKMIKSVTTNMKETNKERIFTPAQTVLKMPLAGQSSSWTVFSEEDGNIKFTSTWTTVMIDGKQRKAIKVIQSIPNYSSKIIEYYVFGIGLWKSEIQSKEKTIISDKLLRLEFDASVTNDYKNGTTLISEYGSCVKNARTPADKSVQMIYENPDHRVILWNDALSNISKYSRERLENEGYDFVKITANDNAHITYCYRNCKENLLLQVTEWYNYKLSLDIQWYSNSVKNSIGYLRFCE